MSQEHCIIMELLLLQVTEHKMNPNERDFDGATTIHFAAGRGHPRVRINSHPVARGPLKIGIRVFIFNSV